MKIKSAWFLGLFIALLAITIILFFRINASSNDLKIDYYSSSENLSRESNGISKFSYLNRIVPDENDVVEINKIDATLKEAALKPLRLLFFGDLMLDRHVAERLENKNISYFLTDFSVDLNFWQNYDLISANLEGAVTNDGEHYTPHNLYDFAFKPSRIAELKDFNFSYFALANNHFSDQGEKGVLETRENLKNLNFYFSGAVDSMVDDNSRFDLLLKDKKISLISLSMVYNNFSLSEAENIIKAADLENDLVIVNIHWGNEYQHNFNRYQKERAYALIEAGADIIIGHHPHVVQGMEIYQEKPIFYSLGNFIFDQYFSADTQEGLALDFEFNKQSVVINLLPFNSEYSAPKLLVDLEKEKFLDKYVNWSDVNEATTEQLKNGYLKLSL